MVRYSSVPEELQKLSIWGLFITEVKPTKTDPNHLTKMPISPVDASGLPSNDSSKWFDFETALDALNEMKFNSKGLAMLIQPPYMFIDLDHKEDEMNNGTGMVAEFLTAANHSYAETSVSGTGLHIIARGKKHTKRSKNSEFGLEMYTDARFVALTGDSFNGVSTIEEVNQEYIDKLTAKYFPEKAPVSNVSTGSIGSELPDDAELLDKAFSAKKGNDFKELYQGNWEKNYSSQSEADQALANHLAFWTNKDHYQMDRLFRQSGLMREKWDEKRGQQTYGAMTLNTAIRDTFETYTPIEKSEYHIDLGFFNDRRKIKFPHPNFKVLETQRMPYFSYDDTGNADRFLAVYPQQFVYDDISKRFLFWNGVRWEYDTSRTTHKALNELVNKLNLEPLHYDESKDVKAKQGQSQEEANEEFKKTIEKIARSFVHKSRQHNGKVGALEEIKGQVGIDPQILDSDKNLINTPNGILQIKDTSLKVIENKPNKYLTKITAGSITNEEVHGSRWERFLNEVFLGDIGTIEFMQRAIGYSLVGNGRERKLFILYGDDTDDTRNGSNGKSLFTQTIADVLGDYSWQSNPLMLIESPKDINSRNATTDISALENRRFVTTTELKAKANLDEAKVKMLTSGEKQNTRELYKEERNFKPSHAIFLTTNYKPRINGTDEAIWSRLVYIPFLAKFTETSTPKIDVSLGSKLQLEKDIIMSWIVAGARDYLENGLNIPNAILLNNENERSSQDVVQMFTDDCLVITGEYSDRVKPIEIKQMFIEWKKGTELSLKPDIFYSMFKQHNQSRWLITNGDKFFTGFKKSVAVSPSKKVVSFDF